MIDLLAGAAEPVDADAHAQLVEEMIRIFESQRLISLTTLFGLVDNLESLSRGEKVNQALITKAASRIAEIQLPRASLSTVEKNQLSFGYWPEKHIEQQRKLNLRALIDRSGNDPKKLDEIRTLLGPFLRDTLVGLTMCITRRPVRRSSIPIRCSCAATTSLGCPAPTRLGTATEMIGGGWPTSAGGKLSVLSPACLTPCRSRTELPRAHPRAGADLGRSGSADDSQRHRAALVERHAGPATLGRACI